MSVTITLKSSSVANKRPVSTSLVAGEVALNYNNGDPGIFFTSSTNCLIKVGPASVSSTAPNSTPAGYAGNSVGEFWYDTTLPGLKIWTGSAWASATSSAVASTPTLLGLSYGCTNLTNSFYGYCSGALGSSSGANVGIGVCALSALTSGSFNTTIGNCAGSGITTGSCNVAIGCGAQVTTASGNCQLAIGFSGTDNWLTGNSTKAIRPGGGIIDCTGVCGTAGQVLASNGNAIVWSSPTSSANATPTTFGILLGCTSAAVGPVAGKVSLGCNALLSLTSGSTNTAVGINALCATTTGFSNTAVGEGNLRANVSGSYNVAVGASALPSGTSSCNTAIGAYSQFLATAADRNTSVGFYSLNGLTTGCDNVAIGPYSLSTNSTAVRNTAVGSSALSTNTVGASNTAVGYATMGSVTTGSFNTALGSSAGGNITTGSCNVSIGPGTQVAVATDNCQLTIGWSSANNWLTGNCFKSIKPAAGIIDKNNVCGSAGQVLMSDGANAICWGTVTTSAIPCATIIATGDIVIGTAPSTPGVQTVGTNGQYLSANSACTTGLQWCTPAFITCATATAKGNIFVATASNAPTVLTVGTDGQYLSANSACTTGLAWVTGSGGGGSAATPLALGSVYGCTLNTSCYATALGYSANCCGASSTVSVTAIGMYALARNAANFNTAVGAFSMCGVGGLGFTITGSFNTALGYATMVGLTTGTCNVAVGSQTANQLTSGSSNTTVGSLAGTSLTSGSCNTLIGFRAGCFLTVGNGNTLIGWCSGSATSFCSISMSNTTVVCNGSGGFCQTGAGAISTISDGRLKECVQDLPHGLAFVNELRPVSWVWNNNEQNPKGRVGLKQAGLIAQDALALQEKYDAKYLGIGQDFNPNELSVSTMAVVPVLIKAVQELSITVETLQSKVVELENKIVSLGQ